MSLHPSYSYALGSLWSAGLDADYSQRRELKLAAESGGFTMSRAELINRAIAGLAAIGFAAVDDAEPLALLGVGVHDFDRAEDGPRAGHVVRCGPGKWGGCDLISLQGVRGEAAPGFTFANYKGSWHLSRRGTPCISMGCGGPASISQIDARKLHDTGERARLMVWSFEDLPRAHSGVHWIIEGPLWEWRIPEGADYWGNAPDMLEWEAAQ